MASLEQLNNYNTSSNGERWGIDKKIPIALILMVFIQTLGFTWGAATLSNDVKTNGKAIAKLEIIIERKADNFEDDLDRKRDKATSQREMDKMSERVLTLESRVRDLERTMRDSWKHPPK